MDFRPATIADAELLLTWRNDPQTRSMSHNTGEVSIADHVAWLEKTLSNPSRRLYIAEMNGIPVGTVRADTSDGITELSWTVAPHARGNGIGKSMVCALARTIRGQLRAEVKIANLASMRIAESAGLRIVGRVGDVVHFSRPSSPCSSTSQASLP